MVAEIIPIAIFNLVVSFFITSDNKLLIVSKYFAVYKLILLIRTYVAYSNLIKRKFCTPFQSLGSKLNR